jgi:hypothetical protein
MASISTEDNQLRAVWVAWAAGVALVCAETFNLVEAAYRSRNGFIVECLAWRDYSAIAFGLVALVLLSIFWAINTGHGTVNWKSWLRRFCFVDAVRVTLYGFGVDVGIGEGCDHIVPMRGPVTNAPMMPPFW